MSALGQCEPTLYAAAASEGAAMHRYKILEAPLDARSLPKAAAEIILLVEGNRGAFVCVADTHSVVTARSDEQHRKILNAAALVTSDGMPLVWLLRWQGAADADRVTGTDLVHEVCIRDHRKSLKHYFLGSTPRTCETFARILEKKYGIHVVGMESPPFRELSAAEKADMRSRINASGANIVWIGLGCPKQEQWMYENYQSLNAVLVGIGAAFDFVAGVKKRAPRWMQHIGLEWFHRLMCEPQRLASRYFSTIRHFIPAVTREIAQLRNR
jgi:N-acetylglucosaminyldiphosphoundecaprenol N-acetyl-beta-D-mannosaminyltransferase